MKYSELPFEEKALLNKRMNLDIINNDPGASADFVHRLYVSICKYYNTYYSNEYFTIPDINNEGKCSAVILDAYKKVIDEDLNFILVSRFVYCNIIADIAESLHVSKNMITVHLNKCYRIFIIYLHDHMDDSYEYLHREDMPTRLYHTLQRGGYCRNSDLKNISYDEFSKIRGGGKLAWINLKQYMIKYNIPFGEDITDVSYIRKKIDKMLAKSQIYKQADETQTNALNEVLDRLECILNDIVK